MKQYKLVIFDLDGTLTPERASSAAPFEQRLLPGVKEKCQELREQDALLAIATNQSKMSGNDELHHLFYQHLTWLCNQVGHLDYVIAYSKWEMKPKPYMTERLMEYHDIAATYQVLMVGNSDTDQKAAIAAGVDFEWAKDFFGWEDK